MEIPVPDGYNQIWSQQIQSTVELTVIASESSGCGALPLLEGDRAMGWAIDEVGEVSAMPCTMPVAVWGEAMGWLCLPDGAD